MDNKFIFIAGVLTIFTALVHLIGGQSTLVNPLLESALTDQVKVEWLGAWHCISIFLFLFGIILIKNGLNMDPKQLAVINLIFQLYLLFAISFILASLFRAQHAPQYILFIPIALLIYLGMKKNQRNLT